MGTRLKLKVLVTSKHKTLQNCPGPHRHATLRQGVHVEVALAQFAETRPFCQEPQRERGDRQ